MKIVYVDMDSVLVNFQSGIDALTEEERTAFKDDLDDVPGIFSKMKHDSFVAWLYNCYCKVLILAHLLDT